MARCRSMAALEVKTGKVEGKTAERHTSAEFLAFVQDLVNKVRWAREIHIVLDNISAHKTNTGIPLHRLAWIVLAPAACRHAARSSDTPFPHSSWLPGAPQALPVF
jgi:DDE superfamily endonuclease